MCRPYDNPMQHITDVIQQAEAFQAADIKDFESLLQDIYERENQTNIFLPLVYLSKLFQLNHPAKKFLYLIAAASLSHAPLQSFLSETLLFQLKQSAIHSFSELLDHTYDIILNKRAASFILDPDYVPLQNWMSVFSDQLNGISILPREDLYRPIHNLIRYFLSGDGNHALCLYGKFGDGRKTLLYDLSVKEDLPVIFVDLGRILPFEDNLVILHSILLEYKLSGSLLCFYNSALLWKEESQCFLAALLNQMEKNIKLTLFVAEQEIPDFPSFQISWTVFSMPIMDPHFLKMLWDSQLKGYQFDQAPDSDYLSRKFRLNPLEVIRCTASAHGTAIQNNESCLSRETLYQHCYNCTAKNLSALGKPMRSPFDMQDIILTEREQRLLLLIRERLEYRQSLFDEFGFDQKFAYGKGTNILFEGPSGTGKTMAAGVLARELKMPLYKINLSAVLSKYIGETEKNLNAVFEEACQVNCILFFDEADSLFGKRTDVSDSKDKFANQEISFLLQKLEEHEGILILATNLIKNMDDAFRRRFEYILRFSLPDTCQRKRLWKSLIPQELPLAEDINFEYLAGQFSFTGSRIKQIILTAAYYAVAEDKILRMSHIMAAIKEDADKYGIPLRQKDFGDLS